MTELRSKGIVAGATAIAALALSGCIGFDGTPKGKQLNANKVVVKFKACSGNSPPTCTDDDNAPKRAQAAEAQGPPPDGEGDRVLIAIRTPPHTGLPQQFTPSGGEFADDPSAVFTRNAPYTDALNAAAPRPGGSRYTGYTSPELEDKRAQRSLAESVPFRLVLRLPDEIGSQFKWRPVLGLTGVADPTVPLDCGHGTQIYEGNEQSATLCIDAPDTHEETSRSLKIPLD